MKPAAGNIISYPESIKKAVTMYSYKDVLAEVLIDEETLQKRIAELAEEISRDYEGKDLVLVCFLRGGVVFLVDLMRKMDIPHSIEFMAISSYGAGRRESSGHVRVDFDLKTDIRGKEVLIVEDIIDSGNTLHAAIPLIEAKGPNSVEICTLLNKVSRREVDIPIRYCGFVIEDKFVYGYGLDLDDYFRNLPFIGVVDTEKLKQIQEKS